MSTSSFDLLDKVDDSMLHEPFQEFKLANGKSYFGNSGDLESYAFTNTYNVLTPLSLNSNLLANGGQYIDIDISGQSMVHRIDNLTLSVNIRNNNATNPALLLPLAYVLNRCEIMCDGAIKETIYSDNLFTQTILSTDELNSQSAIAEGYNPLTYGSDGTGVAALSSRTYSLNIHTFLNKLFMPTVNNARIRFYFNGGASILTTTSVATAGDLVVESLNIYLQGRVYDSEVKNMLIKRFRSGTHISRGIVRRQQIINLGATTAGVQLSQTLSAFTGSFIFLRCLLKNTGASNQSVLPAAYNAWRDISLIDSSGAPFAFQNIPQALIRNTWIPSKYNSKATTVVNMLEIDYSADPVNSFKTFRNAGVTFLDGKYLLKPTPATTVAGGQDLYILSCQETLIMQNPNGTVDVREL